MSHLVEEIDFDIRLQMPFSCQIVGPSGCGKTFFVKTVLENCEHVLSELPDNIVWIYTSFQPMYAELQKKIKNIKFVEGLPDSFEDESCVSWSSKTFDYFRRCYFSGFGSSRGC